MTKEQLEAQNKELKAQLKVMHEKYEYASEKFAELKKRHDTLTTEADKDLYSRAVSTFGETSRLILAIEEMSELIKELSKYTRGRENIGSICEEMADVEIMLEQLKIVFHNRAAVDYHRSQKLQRLSDRLNGNHDSF